MIFFCLLKFILDFFSDFSVSEILFFQHKIVTKICFEIFLMLLFFDRDILNTKYVYIFGFLGLFCSYIFDFFLFKRRKDFRLFFVSLVILLCFDFFNSYKEERYRISEKNKASSKLFK